MLILNILSNSTRFGNFTYIITFEIVVKRTKFINLEVLAILGNMVTFEKLKIMSLLEIVLNSENLSYLKNFQFLENFPVL